LDNEFDHIFREAGQAYRVQPPKSVWRSIRYELEEARGYRMLQWIWPMRLAVAFLVVGASLVSVVQSYDSLEVAQSEPIDYDKVAIELGMVDDDVNRSNRNGYSSNSNNSSITDSKEGQQSSQESPIKVLESTPLTKSKHTPAHIGENQTIHRIEKSTVSVNESRNGLADESSYSNPLSMRYLSLVNAPSLNVELTNPYQEWQYVNVLNGPSIVPNRRWYTQIGYHLGGWNSNFNTESILSLYQYDDPALSYIPDVDPEFIQNVDESWMAQIEIGYRVSEHFAIESGIHLTHIDGSQQTILNVEEQNRYTLERDIAVPSGFNDQRTITIEEEIIDSQVLRDTLTSSFSYQSVSVPLNFIFSARKNKLGVFAGPSVGIQLWNRIETSSSSALYPELNQTQETVIVRPSEMRLGAVTGAQYFVSNQFSVLLDGSLNQHIPTQENSINLENYQSWQVGLGIRYDF